MEKENQLKVKLKQNVFGHWIIVDRADESRAWTGMRFAEIDEDGFSATYQICNFSSKNAAIQFARMYGFEIDKERGPYEGK